VPFSADVVAADFRSDLTINKYQLVCGDRDIAVTMSVLGSADPALCFSTVVQWIDDHTRRSVSSSSVQTHVAVASPDGDEVIPFSKPTNNSRYLGACTEPSAFAPCVNCDYLTGRNFVYKMQPPSQKLFGDFVSQMGLNSLFTFSLFFFFLVAIVVAAKFGAPRVAGMVGACAIVGAIGSWVYGLVGKDPYKYQCCITRVQLGDDDEWAVRLHQHKTTGLICLDDSLISATITRTFRAFFIEKDVVEQLKFHASLRLISQLLPVVQGTKIDALESEVDVYLASISASLGVGRKSPEAELIRGSRFLAVIMAQDQLISFYKMGFQSGGLSQH